MPAITQIEYEPVDGTYGNFNGFNIVARLDDERAIVMPITWTTRDIHEQQTRSQTVELMLHLFQNGILSLNAQLQELNRYSVPVSYDQGITATTATTYQTYSIPQTVTWEQPSTYTFWRNQRSQNGIEIDLTAAGGENETGSSGSGSESEGRERQGEQPEGSGGVQQDPISFVAGDSNGSRRFGMS